VVSFTDIDRLFQELEENKHKIVPADVHDPAIEPLRPSAVSYVNWPLSDRHPAETPPGSSAPVPPAAPASKESGEEQTDDSHSALRTPLGKASFPDLKVYLEPKYPWNESNPVNAVVTGTFGTVKGTLDLTKIGDIIHVHTRRKRQAPSLTFMDRQTLRNLRQMKDELLDENARIVEALHAFKVEVRDVQPPKVGLHGMGTPALIELAKTVLKKRDSLIKRNGLKRAIESAMNHKDTVSQKSIELLVDKREKNVNLIGEINSISDILENGYPTVTVDVPKNGGLSETVERKMNSTEESNLGNVTETGQTSSEREIMSNIVSNSTVEPTQNNDITTEENGNAVEPTETSSSLGVSERPGVNDTNTGAEETILGLGGNNYSVEGANVTTADRNVTVGEANSNAEEGPRNVTVEETKDNDDITSTRPGAGASSEAAPLAEGPQLSPAVEMDIPLVQMGREGGPFAFSSEVDLDSAERSEKKLEIKKVELQENLQSMENATNDSELARASG